MMKKVAYALVLSLGLTTVHAQETTPVELQTTGNAATDLTQQEISGARAWIKNHKKATYALVSTLVGSMILGYLYFSPDRIATAAREKTNAIKQTVTTSAAAEKVKNAWTFCTTHKKYVIPGTVITLILVALATNDLTHDSKESYIKSFVNKLAGNNDESKEINIEDDNDEDTETVQA